MIIIKLSDQLGNQMFAYAMAKSLSLRKGYKLGVNVGDSYYQNSVDKKYGDTLPGVFSSIASEVVFPIGGEQAYEEMSLAERRGEYWKNVESITDGTLIKGHFISYKYFEDYLPQVKQAFSLPDDIIEEADDKVKKIKGAAKSTCSVHFRVGKDYLKGGYMMNYSYWKKAGILMRQRHPGCKFIVFYDRKNKFVERFIHEFDAAELHGSLVEDMAAIEATDYHIVCNSTYSIMSAVLSENDTSIIRPKHYYSGLKEFPQDVFPENWITVKNDRYIPSYVLGYIAALYGKLRKR